MMKSSSVEEAGGGKSTEMSTEDSDSERSVMAVTAEVFAAALVEGVETFALKRGREDSLDHCLCASTTPESGSIG